MPHIRSMDMYLIQNPRLQAALTQSLNHISIRPPKFWEALDVTDDAFTQLYTILNLKNYNLDLNTTFVFLRENCLNILLMAARAKKFSFKESSLELFAMLAVNNELQWLLSHLHISGLDKAISNACFLYICHIMLQAYQRLMEIDFIPCMSDIRWALPTAIFDLVKQDLNHHRPIVRYHF